jgi:hypothetical protein
MLSTVTCELNFLFVTQFDIEEGFSTNNSNPLYGCQSLQTISYELGFPWWSGAFALLGGFFAFALNTGLLKKFAAAQLGKDSFLLYSLVEPPQ